MRFCPLGFFVPEKRFPRRLVVTLVFRCLIPSGKETNRKRLLTRTSPLRRKRACEMVDEDVNITERQIYN